MAEPSPNPTLPSETHPKYRIDYRGQIKSWYFRTRWTLLEHSRISPAVQTRPPIHPSSPPTQAHPKGHCPSLVNRLLQNICPLQSLPAQSASPPPLPLRPPRYIHGVSERSVNSSGRFLNLRQATQRNRPKTPARTFLNGFSAMPRGRNGFFERREHKRPQKRTNKSTLLALSTRQTGCDARRWSKGGGEGVRTSDGSGPGSQLKPAEEQVGPMTLPTRRGRRNFPSPPLSGDRLLPSPRIEGSGCPASACNDGSGSLPLHAP